MFIPTECVRRAGWLPYTIQVGDTLFSLSVRVGLSLSDLQAANCIANPAQIQVGQVIALPPGSIAAVTAIAATSNPTDAIAYGCGNSLARISSPLPGSVLTGQFSVRGTAKIPNFSFYKLEVRADSSQTYVTFFTNRTPQTVDGELGTLNAKAFPPGLYWIQLVAIDATSNYPVQPCQVRVRFG